jgi:hypothetical protein
MWLLLQVDVITMTGRCGNFDETHPYNEYDMDTWVTEEEHWNIILEPSAKRYSYVKGKFIHVLNVSHNVLNDMYVFECR